MRALVTYASGFRGDASEVVARLGPPGRLALIGKRENLSDVMRCGHVALATP